MPSLVIYIQVLGCLEYPLKAFVALVQLKHPEGLEPSLTLAAMAIC